MTRRLVAFDLGGTLEITNGRPLYPDLKPALQTYAEEHPDTSFGIATNGGWLHAIRFIETNGLEPFFADPKSAEPLIAYPGMVEARLTPVDQPVSANWKERILGQRTATRTIVVETQQILRAKPEPDMLEYLMRQTEAAAQQTVFVGDDQIDDGLAAKAAGVGFVMCDKFELYGTPDAFSSILQRAEAALQQSSNL